MLFNSYEFLLLFLPIAILLFFLCSKWFGPRGGIVLLVIASFSFYGYWDVSNVPILLISILFNFFLATKISKQRSLYWLISGLVFNIGLLIYYKYAIFLLSILTSIFSCSLVSLSGSIAAMPLGISFFTFTQTAFLIDVYRAERKKTGFWEYLLFVTFFPHLIAGPILYHKDILPQFQNVKTFTFSHENFSKGLIMFSIGLFKKVVIADSLIEWVSLAFARPGELSFFEAWFGALAYTFQLYYDFSGYSDMAVGLGWMFNIRLPINFNSPYRATSMTQFWNCWHMTLITFLNQYLFSALGGFRVSYWRAMLNIMITITVAGVWHGAGWSFIAYGFLCGAYLVVNYSWRRFGFFQIPKFLSWVIVFSSLVVAAVVFRAPHLSDAGVIIGTMLGFKGIVVPLYWVEEMPFIANLFVSFANWQVFILDVEKLVVILGVLVLSIHVIPNTNEMMKAFVPNRKWALLAMAAFALSFIRLHQVTEFLYFQF